MKIELLRSSRKKGLRALDRRKGSEFLKLSAQLAGKVEKEFPPPRNLRIFRRANGLDFRMRGLVSAPDPPPFGDFRDFHLPGHDTSVSEEAHRCYIHWFFAPAETKQVLQHIERAANNHPIVPFSKIDLAQLRPGRGLFSWELDSTGKRTFFALNYADTFKLFNYTRELHLYEVIPEAAPCHLYFDCEFLFASHADFDGPALIAKLVQRVNDRLLAVFGQDEYELVELDATTPAKFSRHLIFRSDRFCFRSNRHVGHFVETEILPEFAGIVDPAVYTRNRNFRCVWSTKMANGSRYPLIPSDGTNYAPAMSDCAFFRRTLVCDVGITPYTVGYPELGTVEKVARQPVKKVTQPALTKAAAGTIKELAVAEFAEAGGSSSGGSTGAAACCCSSRGITSATESGGSTNRITCTSCAGLPRDRWSRNALTPTAPGSSRTRGRFPMTYWTASGAYSPEGPWTSQRTSP
jgi:hypothetical protein